MSIRTKIRRFRIWISFWKRRKRGAFFERMGNGEIDEAVSVENDGMRNRRMGIYSFHNSKIKPRLRDNSWLCEKNQRKDHHFFNEIVWPSLRLFRKSIRSRIRLEKAFFEKKMKAFLSLKKEEHLMTCWEIILQEYQSSLSRWKEDSTMSFFGILARLIIGKDQS